MPRAVPPALSLVLNHLRTQRAWTQAELAQAAAMNRQDICDFETGLRRTLDHPTLLRLAAAMGYLPGDVDLALAFVNGLRAAAAPERLSPIDPSSADVRRARQIAARFGLTEASRMYDDLLDLGRLRRIEQARCAADGLWQQLVGEPPDRQSEVVTSAPGGYQWALVERLCTESVRAAADDASRALHLAKVALGLAEQAPGASGWRSRLQGYAWAFVANAQRVGSDLPAAEGSIATAWRLWREAGPGRGGPLGEWRLYDLEASLRRDLRQFEAALDCLSRALASAPTAMRGRILLNKQATLEQAGDLVGALDALERAAPLIDVHGEPRDRRVLRFNAVVMLCHLGRHAAAADRLVELRRMLTEHGDRLDLTRTFWLSGRVAAGLGHSAEARVSFEQARREFTKGGLAYDTALVALELAVLLLGEGQSAEVTAMAEEMLWIFKSQKVHREALAALRLFCTAARSGSVTVGLARNVLAFLDRARHDPHLRFTEFA